MLTGFYNLQNVKRFKQKARMSRTEERRQTDHAVSCSWASCFNLQQTD